MSSEPSRPAIRLRGAFKHYYVYPEPMDRLKQALFPRRRFYREVRALEPIDLEIRRGETVGVVGRNGSGKSTLLQIIAGTLTPTGGEVEVNGRVAALLELGAGFNPDFTGRENVYLNAALIGLSREETQQRFGEILEFSEIGDFIDQPVRTYSSGMYVRLAFAVSISVDPDILIVDEALAVGDEAFQRKCFARIEGLQKRGATVLFVSHSSMSVVQLCSRAVLMDRGEKILDGMPKFVTAQYHRLLYAPAERQASLREELKGGRIASPSAPPAGTETAASPEQAPVPERRAYYDPEMQSRSQMAFESRGALIEDPHLEDLDGERVNVLTRGDEYVYTFRVRFTEPAFGALFGMYIRTLTGVDLGGSASARFTEPLGYVEAGSQATVRFRFECRLLAGTYFINAGTSAIVDGERQVLHRLMDAVMFRVQPESDPIASGIVDFAIRPAVDVDQPSDAVSLSASDRSRVC